jgi:1,4-alpha-glucan branching enzyme
MVKTLEKTKTKNIKLTKKRVDFSLFAPAADEVKLAGDFTDWQDSPAEMRRLKNGAWKKTVYLPLGAYQYRFVVDGEWTNDPDSALREPNPFGDENNVCVVE